MEELQDKAWKIIETLQLPVSAIALLNYLIWKSKNAEEIKVADSELIKIFKFSKPTLINSRKILQECKLINYHRESGKSGMYILNIKSNEQIKQVPRISKTKKLENGQQPSVISTNNNIPTLEEFMAFAKTVEIYDPKMDFQIKTKYEQWKGNGWKNLLNGRPLHNWQGSLKQSMPHFNTKFKGVPEVTALPSIKRIMTTYDE